jgi:hypothetical protein
LYYLDSGKDVFVQTPLQPTDIIAYPTNTRNIEVQQQLNGTQSNKQSKSAKSSEHQKCNQNSRN